MIIQYSHLRGPVCCVQDAVFIHFTQKRRVKRIWSSEGGQFLVLSDLSRQGESSARRCLRISFKFGFEPNDVSKSTILSLIL